MRELLGFVIAMVCAGCMGHAQKRVAEKPDETVGDLRCSAPHLTVLEALYYVPTRVDCAP